MAWRAVCIWSFIFQRKNRAFLFRFFSFSLILYGIFPLNGMLFEKWFFFVILSHALFLDSLNCSYVLYRKWLNGCDFSTVCHENNKQMEAQSNTQIKNMSHDCYHKFRINNVTAWRTSFAQEQNRTVRLFDFLKCLKVMLNRFRFHFALTILNQAWSRF